MEQQSYAYVLDEIKSGSRVLVLLEKPGDPVCLRFRQAFASWLLKFEQLGFKSFAVNVNEEACQTKEFAAAYIPQVRLFEGGKLLHKLTGIQNDADVREVVTALT